MSLRYVNVNVNVNVNVSFRLKEDEEITSKYNTQNSNDRTTTNNPIDYFSLRTYLKISGLFIPVIFLFWSYIGGNQTI